MMLVLIILQVFCLSLGQSHGWSFNLQSYEIFYEPLPTAYTQIATHNNHNNQARTTTDSNENGSYFYHVPATFSPIASSSRYKCKFYYD